MISLVESTSVSLILLNELVFENEILKSCSLATSSDYLQDPEESILTTFSLHLRIIDYEDVKFIRIK